MLKLYLLYTEVKKKLNGKIDTKSFLVLYTAIQKLADKVETLVVDVIKCLRNVYWPLTLRCSRSTQCPQCSLRKGGILCGISFWGEYRFDIYDQWIPRWTHAVHVMPNLFINAEFKIYVLNKFVYTANIGFRHYSKISS